MRTFVGAVPLSAVALLVFSLLALALSRVVADRLGTGRAVAALLLFGFGLVLSATLTPTGLALHGSVTETSCDTTRIGLAPIAELVSVNFTSLNVLLFVPLGLSIGLLPRTRAMALITLAAVALPFIVEAVQLAITVLDRRCQTADVFDNLLGLAVGVLLGTLARPLLAAVGPPRRPR
ncbi:MAG: VanZ family protein [Candidatus Limnocylindrales bacterium]